MATHASSTAAGRLADALGLDKCESVVINLAAGEVVTVVATQYVTEQQLNTLAWTLETNEFVVLPREEYERLAARERREGE